MTNERLDDTFLPIEAKPPTLPANGVLVAAFQERSFVAGPGCRAVVWVAGCLRRCPSCSQPEFLSFEAGKRRTVQELYEQIISTSDIVGVTYSGGEPFEQADQLGELSERLQQFGLSTASYSGYRRAALVAEPKRFGRLYNALDILIDGEYRKEAHGPYKWRGSGNQVVHALSPKGMVEARAEYDPGSTQEVQFSISGNRLRMSGFPDSDTHELLVEALASRGVLVKEGQQ
ncbi:Pyruvate formate-lyase 1-activating enzyme [Posidoniimonas polymericola]|uniref:Pyruvate formate-lyase 1-activating enzyme n=1 Tax=Posidoniimonas polymericola TaxID=2528002 RepID=A0A5C5XVI2_9BACT|nr:4Fe-4S single cluster domain-containing protein [Posidoniimonas polymericola]TWT66904.1 Pyruvate formate-lyase 1-activating enzyme [Posidoniimonas polymericola]